MPALPSKCLMFALIVLTSACQDRTTTTTVVTENSSMMDGHISLKDDTVVLKPDGIPQAFVSAAGDFIIDGRAVAVSPDQRNLFKNYYSGVLGIRDHGIATGAAAAGVARTALSSVAKGLANGETKNIDAEVSASKAKVEAQATSICRDLAQAYTAQQSLAAQLDAFKAYAVIQADEPHDCLHNIEGNRHDS
jgi:hypothetical protein